MTVENKEENKEKTAKDLKQELAELRSKEIQEITKELNEFLQERNISLGSRTITGEGGKSRNDIFIIDNL